MSAPFGKPELHPESIPAELKTRPRWLLWRLEDRNGKPSKTPYQASGALAKVNDPSTWTSFNAALAAYLKGGFSGIGFALSDDDDLLGVDLDKCLDPDTGELEPEAADIVAMLPTYCEVSPSGRGLRLFAFGKLPQGGRRKGKVEMYESGRYLTVTGHRFNGHDSITECTAQLAQVHARIFGAGATSSPVAAKACQANPPDLDDAALLDKARRARNGADFERLWAGDLSGHNGDASAADLALCNLLAFWTAGDAGRMDRLFRQSALFRPAKWDKVHYSDGRTYGQGTIERALAGNRETYSGKPSPTIAKPQPVANDAGPAGAGAVNDGDLAGLFQTDLGNSERLVARHGRDLRYCFDFGKWLCWDGVRWAIDRNGAALDTAKATARAMLAEAATLGDKEDARKLAAWSFRSQARERMAAMLFLAQPDVSVLPERLDTHPWLLNVANGTLDLRTGQLRQPDRADLLSKALSLIHISEPTRPY